MTLLLAGAVGLVPAASMANAAPAAAHPAAAALPAATTVPVTGTLNGLPFSGTLSNLSTSVVNGALQLTGTLTSAALPGGALNFAVPITPTAVCNVLSLNLGPLHLDVLGLVIDLNQVVLNITAQPGPGQLLGNLLCAVAHLLDNGGPLTGISALLNQLLTRLGL
ncbi:hypothetical protein GKE56_12370 [Nostocoides sp. HKS02]|nr:hypothetical protein GKE56_12370 [Tetrasphaera sp. HKS02]